MSTRVATLAFGMSLVLIVGCPSEKKQAEDDGSSGTGGDSGEGGEGGTSGDSGEGGIGGSDEVPDLPADEAAAGMCEMADETEGCTGLDAYQECLNTECNFAQCHAGPCATFIDCLSEAESACEAVQEGTCERSQECSDCFMADANCLLNCYEHVDCGDGMAGRGGTGGEAGTGGVPEATCEDLDACCASLSEEEAMACTLVADSAREQGDFACAVYVDAFCP